MPQEPCETLCTFRLPRSVGDVVFFGRYASFLCEMKFSSTVSSGEVSQDVVNDENDDDVGGR